MYAKDLFGRYPNLTEQEALGILKNRRNYNYKGNSVLSVGKFCDTTVNEIKFKEALTSLTKTLQEQNHPLIDITKLKVPTP